MSNDKKVIKPPSMLDALITLLFVILDIKIARLKTDEPAKDLPGEAAWRGVGGQRVEPTEHELVVTKG